MGRSGGEGGGGGGGVNLDIIDDCDGICGRLQGRGCRQPPLLLVHLDGPVLGLQAGCTSALFLEIIDPPHAPQELISRIWGQASANQRNVTITFVRHVCLASVRQDTN